MWKVTFKGLMAHKIRFALTALAVVLGVAFLAGTLVLTDTVGKAFDSLFEDINEGTDVVVRKVEPFEVDFGPALRPRIEDEFVAEIAAVDGAEEVEGQIGGFALMVDGDGDPIGGGDNAPPTFGFNWPAVDDFNPLELVEGNPPLGPDEIAIDRVSVETGDLVIGDTVGVITEAGLNEFVLTGVVTFGETDNIFGGTTAVFESTRAQELLGAPGEWSDIRVVAAGGVSSEELSERIATELGAGSGAREDIEVLTGAELTAEDQSDIAEALSFFDTFLLVFAGIALFVGAFIIYNTFSIVVAQRAREMALLRAVGASRSQVQASVLGEALLVALVASAIGLGVGILLAQGLTLLLEAAGLDIPSTGAVIALRTVIAAFTVGIIVTLVSALMPAYKASKVPPIAALRDVASDASSRSWVRTLSGCVVLGGGILLLMTGLFGSTDQTLQLVGLGAAVVFLGVAVLGPVIAEPVATVIGAPLPLLRGMTGRLARENAKRNPKRTAATAAALMIGVGLVGFIAIFANSAKASINDVIDRAFRADFVIESGSFGFGGFSTDVADSVRELDGIQAVSPLRFGPAQFGEDSVFVNAVDPESINILFDVGVSEGQIEGMSPTDVAMFRDRVEDEGLALGDTVTLNFADTGPQDFTLVSIYDEPEPAEDFTISLDAYDNNFAAVFDTQLYVKYPDGTDLEAVRPELEAVVAEVAPNGEVQDQAEFRESIASQINTLLNLIFALLFFAIIIALIGIANALALSIFERTREIGLLRAVGMSRRQVRSAVRWEAVIIALLGTVLGLIISVGFGWALVKALEEDGFEVFSIPVGQMISILVLSALAGVIAAIGPARRAAKLDVLEAIATE